MNYLKSPLKWVGGKSKVLPNLFNQDMFKNLSRFETYIEPFVGGGSVFLNVEHDNIVISDSNPDLINFYEQVKNNLDGVVGICEDLFLKVSQEDYYYNREVFRKSCNKSAIHASLFLYLNKVGYKGMCRYSKRNGFNVSYGHYKNVYFPENELITLHNKLQNVTILNKDCFELLDDYVGVNNVAIYCDPPYFETFDAYTKEGFNLDSHNKLDYIANKLTKDNNNSVIISNSFEAIKIYSPRSCEEILVKRCIANPIKGIRKVKECIFTY